MCVQSKVHRSNRFRRYGGLILAAAVMAASCSPNDGQPSGPAQPAAELDGVPAGVKISEATEAAANTKSPADGTTPAYDACMNTGEAAEGITAAMLDCIHAEIGVQDAKLNATYKSVMASLRDEQKVSVREAQRNWIKLRDSKCWEAPTGGTMDLLRGTTCVLDMTIERTVELEDIRQAN